MFDCSVFQGNASDGAALTVGHKKAVPGIATADGQSGWLSKTSLVWVRIVPVFLVTTPSKPDTGSSREEAGKKKTG